MEGPDVYIKLKGKELEIVKEKKLVGIIIDNELNLIVTLPQKKLLNH